MKITQIDEIPNLFLIEDILPNNIIEKIAKESLLDYEWELQSHQLHWKRRRLKPNTTSPLAMVDFFYDKCLDQIADATNVEFFGKHCFSNFWLDYEGFDVDIHLDGADRNFDPLMAMQIYLTGGDFQLGTVFYKDRTGKLVRYQFPYKINTGYLMLNGENQWHGMLNPVPSGHIRLSSYTYFSDFNHK